MLKMAHGHNTVIKSEIECNNKPRNFPPDTGCYNMVQHHQNQNPTQQQQQQRPTASKMGSRRIFTPQFKLQVLESYRNDSDCKGNQRATARKYGIHRRQIQKWLQVEDNLRSVVANSANSKNILLSNNNTNSHNHNLSLDVKLPSHPSSTTLSGAARHRVVVESMSINKSSHSHNHHHHTQHSIHSAAAATVKMLSQMSSPTHHHHHHHVGAFISPVHSYVCDRSAVSFASPSSYGEYESPSSVSLSSPNSPITSTHTTGTLSAVAAAAGFMYNNHSAKDRRGFSTSPTSSFTPYHPGAAAAGSNGHLEPALIQIPPIAMPSSHPIFVPSPTTQFVDYAYYPQTYPPPTANITAAASAPVTPLITGPITHNAAAGRDRSNHITVAAASTKTTAAIATTSASSGNCDDQCRDDNRLQQSSPIDLSVPHAQRKIEVNACKSRTPSPYDSKCWVNVDEDFDDDDDDGTVDKKNITLEHNQRRSDSGIVSADGEIAATTPTPANTESDNAVDLTCRKRKRHDSTEDDEDEAISCSPPPKTIKLFKPYLLDEDTEQSSNSGKHHPHAAVVSVTKNLNANGSSKSRNASAVADQKQRIKKNFDDEQQHRQRDAIIWNNHHHHHHHHNTSPYAYSDSYSSPAASYPVSPTYSPTAYWSQASPVSGYDSSSSIYSDSEVVTPLYTEPTHSSCRSDDIAVAL